MKHHMAKKDLTTSEPICEVQVSRISFLTVIFVFEMLMCKARFFFQLSISMELKLCDTLGMLLSINVGCKQQLCLCFHID